MSEEVKKLAGSYADDPVGKSRDSYDRQTFARRVCDLLKEVADESNSSVAALVGPWGSGKSSVLTMVQEELEADGGWIVRNFNPWLFDGVQSLLETYFSELTLALPEKVGDEGRKKVASFFRSVAPFSKLGSVFGLDPSAAVTEIARLVAGDESVEATRSSLAKALGDMDDRILIVIDDLDRLQPAELLLVLKLIRLIGNLPNIYYLLSFDERSILDALKSNSVARDSEARANRYLEKMVQLRLDLPRLNDTQVLEAFQASLDSIAESAGIGIGQDERSRLDDVYRRVFRHSFAVPRSLNRFFAQLRAFYVGLSDEVDLVDFMILTYLRVSYSTFYSSLPRYKERLLGKPDSASELVSPDPAAELKIWSDRLLAEHIEGEEAREVLDLLAQVFPPVRANLDGRSGYGDSHHASLRSGKRAGAPEYFDRYFQLSVPEHDVPDSATVECLRHLVGGASRDGHECNFERWLSEKPSLLLDKLDSLIDSVPVTDPEPLFNLLARTYASTDEIERASWVGGPQSSMQSVVTKILRRLPEERAAAASRALLVDGIDSRLAGDVARYLNRFHQELGWLPAFVEQVAARLFGEIEDWTSLPTVDDWDRYDVFFKWSHLNSAERVREVARTRIEAGAWDLLDYLELIAPYRIYKVSGGVDYRYSEFDVPWLERYIGLEFAVTAAGALLDADLPAPESFIDQPIDGESSRKYMLSCLAVGRERFMSSEEATTQEQGGPTP